MRALALSFVALLVAFSAPLLAQDKGTLDPKPLPPLAHPEDPAIPAKELFGRKTAPASLEARAIGFYAHGCLAGAKALPVDGEAWQVMRLSRNRNWGHPALIDFLERFAKKIPKVNGWPGILVGDISQPRGGPMLTGHASHQVGLDADIWLTPMSDRKLSREEREEMSATNVVRDDGLDVNKDWTPKHMEAIKAAAQDPAVQRIFVNAAIKKAICREAKGDRTWLEKVRPMYGHNYHFHVRMRCPKRRQRLPRSGAGARRRRLRQRLAGLLVPAFRAASEARRECKAEAGSDDGGASRRMPQGAGGEVT